MLGTQRRLRLSEIRLGDGHRPRNREPAFFLGVPAACPTRWNQDSLRVDGAGPPFDARSCGNLCVPCCVAAWSMGDVVMSHTGKESFQQEPMMSPMEFTEPGQ